MIGNWLSRKFVETGPLRCYLEVTVTAFATHIGVSRPMFSRMLDGRSVVIADMDLRDGKRSDSGPPPYRHLLDDQLRSVGARAERDRREALPGAPARSAAVVARTDRRMDLERGGHRTAKGNPRLETLLSVIAALGLRLDVRSAA